MLYGKMRFQWQRSGSQLNKFNFPCWLKFHLWLYSPLWYRFPLTDQGIKWFWCIPSGPVRSLWILTSNTQILRSNEQKMQANISCQIVSPFAIGIDGFPQTCMVCNFCVPLWPNNFWPFHSSFTRSLYLRIHLLRQLWFIDIQSSK